MSNRFFEALIRVGSAIHEGRMRARTRAELSQLSDRQLTDIGVSRSEIPSVAARGRNY